MRMFVPNVLLLLAIATFTHAVPLSSQRSEESDADSSQDSAQSLSSQESDEAPISLKIDEVENADLNLAAEYDDTNPTIVKREIPDPEKPCGCKSKSSSKSNEPSDEDEHDRYLAYTNPNVRDRRQVSDDGSSEEAAKVGNCDCADNTNISSEEAQAPVPQSEEEQQDPIWEQAIARRKRDVDAESALDDEDTASEEQSQVVSKLDSEEQANIEADALVAEDNEDADLIKSLEQKDEAAAARQKRHPDNYSLEDYAQGCEETEVNSYEANETTYKEDDKKRKRRAADSSQSSSDESKSKSGSSSEEKKESQKQNRSEKEAETKNK